MSKIKGLFISYEKLRAILTYFIAIRVETNRAVFNDSIEFLSIAAFARYENFFETCIFFYVAKLNKSQKL